MTGLHIIAMIIKIAMMHINIRNKQKTAASPEVLESELYTITQTEIAIIRIVPMRHLNAVGC